MVAHLVKVDDGRETFQSDKYPWAAPDFLPLKITDPMAQDLLWEHAERRRRVDPEFADDLQTALRNAGYDPRETIWRSRWL